MALISFNCRIAAYLLALLFCVFSSEQAVLTYVIYLGQAHFILAYWYKFERIPSLPKAPFFWIWIASIFSLLLLSLSGTLSYSVLIAVTSVLFVGHFIIDEIQITGQKMSVIAGALSFGGLIILFFIEISEFVLHAQFTEGLLVFLSLATFLGTATTVWLGKNDSSPSYFQTYILIVAALSSIIILFSNSIYLSYSLGFIILAHIFIWYFHYYIKLRSQASLLVTYIKRVLLIHMIMLTLWAVAILGFPIPLSQYVFSEFYYYLWACLHIIFSFIPKDIGIPFLKNQFFRQ